MKKKRKNTNRPNFHKGSQSHIPSQTIGGAKVQIISQNAIQNLKNLSQKYQGINDPRGFLTDLRNALGLPDSQGASKYGVITIPKDDGTFLEVSLRITNHQANANTYIEHNANYEYNLSIVIKKQRRRNTFIPNDNVKLDEYVYYGDNLQKIENPLSKIAEGLIGYLQNGTYEDKTGVGLPNVSPKPQNNQENINCNRNMNKNRMRLTESQLHRVIKESVKRLLKENSGGMRTAADNSYKHQFIEKYINPLYQAIGQGIEQGDILILAKCYQEIADLITNDEIRYQGLFVDLLDELREKRNILANEMVRIVKSNV